MAVKRRSVSARLTGSAAACGPAHGLAAPAARRGLPAPGRRKADAAKRHEREAPADQGGEADAGHRRQRPTDVPGDTVDAVGAAEPRPADARIQDREIGRVKDAVAEAGRHRQREQEPEGRHQPHQRRGARGHGEAAEQDAPRPDAVDEKAGGRLRDARHGVERGRQQPQRLVADIEGDDEQRKERRQDELEEMAEPVRGAHQPDHRRVPAKFDRRDRHACSRP